VRHPWSPSSIPQGPPARPGLLVTIPRGAATVPAVPQVAPVGSDRRTSRDDASPTEEMTFSSRDTTKDVSGVLLSADDLDHVLRVYKAKAMVLARPRLFMCPPTPSGCRGGSRA
jgi:hypothetical protein